MSIAGSVRAAKWATVMSLALGVGLRAGPRMPSTSYTAVEVGPDPVGWAMVQGPEGILFFGSDRLLTFDGDRWTEHPAGQGIQVRSLDFDRNDRLWAAATGDLGYFTPASGGGWGFHSLLEFLPAEERTIGEVWSVFAGAGDTATFVSQDRVLRWNGSTFSVTHMAGAKRLIGLRTADGIYVQHSPTGLYRVTEQRLDLVIPAGALPPGALIYYLEKLPGPDREYFFVTSAGMFSWQSGRLLPLIPEATDFIVRQRVSAVTRLRDGRLAIGSLRGGVLLLTTNGQHIEQVLDTSTASLPSNLVLSIAEDREGGLWINSTASVTRLPARSGVEIYDRTGGLPASPISHIAVADDGTVMAATDDAIFGKSADRADFSQLPYGQHVYSILADGSMVWIGRNGRLDKLQLHGLAASWSGEKTVFGLAAAADRPGIYLTMGRDLEFLASKPGSKPVRIASLPENAFRLTADNRGTVWIGGSTSGLVSVNTGTGQIEYSHDGLPASFARGSVGVARDKAGDIFVFSEAAGYVRGAGSDEFLPILSYPSRPIVAMSSGADGAWVVHSVHEGLGACVARIERQGDHFCWRPFSVEGLNKIGPPRSMYADERPGRTPVLWIGGSFGLLSVDMSGDVSSRLPPAPLMRGLRDLDDGTVTTLSGPLPYNFGHLRFEFAVPTFARRSSIRCESFIDGFDKKWMPVGIAGRRDLSALREGTFVVRARAVAETGEAGPEAVTTIIVRPPWWRTPETAAAAATALALGVYAGYRIRVRRLRARTEELEEAVRRRTEQAQKATAEAEAANAAKTEFVARVSHDIRNPLHGLSGLALALEDPALGEERRQEYVAAVKACATSLTLLLDDVLDFAQIEAGRVTLQPTSFDPRHVLQLVADSLQIEARRHHSIFRLITGESVPRTIVADIGRVQEIVMNYATNALKYAPGDIRLSVIVSPERPGEVQFAVSDNGAGFSEEQKSRLFLPFSRLAEPRSGIKGSGMGLAVCRRLGDLMGGSVGVDSSPGRGATFYLRLPLVTTSEMLNPEPVPFCYRCVLLVEDVTYNLWSTSVILERIGIKVTHTAVTGAEAVRLFGENEFELVLLDRNLPDCDGLEVARQMRLLEGGLRHATLVAVTAYSTMEDRQACLDAGMDGFIGKPMTPDKVRRVLTTIGDNLAPAPAVVEAGPAGELDMAFIDLLAPSAEGDSPLERFTGELQKELTGLEQLRGSGDLGAVRAAAHRTLGLAQVVNATDAIAALRHLYEAARAELSNSLPELLAAAIDRTREIISDLNREHPSPPSE